MRKIFASIDVGSDLIKLVVAEVTHSNRMNILASAHVESLGVKKGFIVNPEALLPKLQEVFLKCENIIGLKIDKVLYTKRFHLALGTALMYLYVQYSHTEGQHFHKILLPALIIKLQVLIKIFSYRYLVCFVFFNLKSFIFIYKFPFSNSWSGYAPIRGNLFLHMFFEVLHEHYSFDVLLLHLSKLHFHLAFLYGKQDF